MFLVSGLFAGVVSGLVPDAAGAAEKYATQAGAGDKDGSDWANAYGEGEFIAALAASPGNGVTEFRVAAGTYRPVIPAGTGSVTAAERGKSFRLKSNVALYGGFTGTETSREQRNPEKNITILTGDLLGNDGLNFAQRGDNSYHVITADTDVSSTAILGGFTISGGNANGSSSETVLGGGMYNSSGDPTVTECVFSGNQAAEGGGGMYNVGGKPMVTACTFSDNKARYGGGMSNIVSTCTVRGCTFSGNTVELYGGGMYNTGGKLTMTACAFSGNKTDSDSGGGMYNTGGKLTMTACTFSGNTVALYGGGMYNENGDPTVTECVFSGNQAVEGGGGMYNTDGNLMVKACTFLGNTVALYYGGGMYNKKSTGTVMNCTFSGNTAKRYGGGMYNDDLSGDEKYLLISNCTFSNNTADLYKGHGLYCTSYRTLLTNCIFWSGSSSTKQIYEDDEDGDFQIQYSITTEGGTGNKNSDPKLGPPAWNGGTTKTCAISGDSPAFNAGRNVGAYDPISVPPDDQRGVSRPQGTSVDIGAYEYWADKKILLVSTGGVGNVTRDPPGDDFGTSGKQWSYDTDAVVTLTASADAPWCFAEWSGDIDSTDSITETTMNVDKNVTACFERGWIVVASADAGGVIVPAGNVLVGPGKDQTFTITPDSDFSIADVIVDGVSVGAKATHTFTDVSGDHTIEASFAAAPTVTPTSSPTPTGGVTPTSSPAPTGGVTPTSSPTPTGGVTPTSSPAPTGGVTPTSSPAPTGGVTPTSTPTPTGGVTPTSSPTPSPFPSPDPGIPLPSVTLRIMLVSGGTIIAGPLEITDPDEQEALLTSLALRERLLAFDPEDVAAGSYNRGLARFFSLLAQLDAGGTELTLLLEVTVGNVEEGYTAGVFLLARTFDDDGNPVGFVAIPREEGTTLFRRRAGAEIWKVDIVDGSKTDGDPDKGSVLPNLAAVVAVVPGRAATATPTNAPTGVTGGGSSGCDSGGAYFAPFLVLLLAPLLMPLKR